MHPLSACFVLYLHEWLPVACKLWPLWYNLYATGGHTGTIYMRLDAIRMQTLRALAASFLQARCENNYLN